MNTMIRHTEAERAQPQAPLWRVLLGWICLGGGILGLFLPLLPGVPLLFAGLFLLSGSYEWARKCLLWLKRRARSLRPIRGRH
jgi:uncharacterized membrane protein YbaN (DUF454 family)